MGNDGGSIPTRRELVKEAARNPTVSELKETRQEHLEHLWKNDPLSHRPLSRPVVSDCLGRLFNKDSIIEFLLPSDADDDDIVKHTEQENILGGQVKTLKDVVEVKFETGLVLSVVDSRKPLRRDTVRSEVWICPVTNKELGSNTKSVYLVPCGHAFAEVAIKEVSDDKCLQCNEPYAPNDVIPILSTSEADVAGLTLRMKLLREKGLTHSLKKAAGSSKKRKKNGTDVVATEGDVPPEVSIEQGDVPKAVVKSSTPQPVSGTHTPTLGIKNAATASLTARVLEEQEERNKRRKMVKNQNISSLFSTTSQAVNGGKGKNTDFMSRGYAIPAHQQR